MFEVESSKLKVPGSRFQIAGAKYKIEVLMAKVERFEDLEIWQLAREICNKVHQIFETTSLGSNYALRNQMDKSSGSIMDNNSEGFERNGNREFIQFLSIAKASCGELRSQLYRVLDRNHIDRSSFEVLYELVLLKVKKSVPLLVTCPDQSTRAQNSTNNNLEH